MLEHVHCSAECTNMKIYIARQCVLITPKVYDMRNNMIAMLIKTYSELTPYEMEAMTHEEVGKIFLRARRVRRGLLDPREGSGREGSSGVGGAVEAVQVSDRLLQLVSATQCVTPTKQIMWLQKIEICCTEIFNGLSFKWIVKLSKYIFNLSTSFGDNILISYRVFLATLVALHFTLVSKSVSQ